MLRQNGAKWINYMKVAVYYRNDDVRIEERPVPSIADGEILVRMKACGICGTDVMEWYRMKKAPCVLGHEMAGEIVKVGRDVQGFMEGSRVFVSHHVPCYKCHYCLQGKYTACEGLHMGNYYPGGFAEYIRVPEENVKYGTFLLPESLTYEEAAMIEPLACAIAGQNQLNMKEGQTVLIIGSGISGLLHIHLAKLKGAKVISTDINEYRLKKAFEFGTDFSIDAGEYSSHKLKSVNSDRMADIVIVCAAARKAVEDAISSADRKGEILFFSVPDFDINIPSVQFWRNEISVHFSYGAAPENLRAAIELIQDDTERIRKMITHRVSLSEIQHGFKLVSAPKDSLKVVVIPDN
jgi:L-iditol 2-dehydrogenase